MKRIVFGCIALSVLAVTAAGQNPSIRRPAEKATEKSGESAEHVPWSRTTPSEAMWFYEQEKRDFLDTTLAIRRRAEFTAWQRRHRLAATQWYGYSNSRPNWHPTPAMSGTFSPAWTGNDYLDRYRWSTATPPVVIRPSSDSYYK
jgi:hypothetical protein